MRKAICTMIFLCFCVAVFGACSKQEETTLHPVTEADFSAQEEVSHIFVHVCGAVKSPGVYELPVGSRVYEAVEVAGGFQKKADTAGLNQAELLEDGMQLYVPAKESRTSDATSQAKVNLNTATVEELMTLTGIGEAKAKAIIAYRERHGRFKKKEDIMNISGIKEGMFSKIEDDITV